MPILHARNVCKDFQVGEELVHVLKNVDISIDKGSFSVLKGRSGSGKTTLMNILGALDTPTSGSVFFKDSDITSLHEKGLDRLRRESMGFVFQSVALVPMMTAYENIEFGLRVAGYAYQSIDNRCRECLELVGLGKRHRHMPGELSGGEQQRVAIARAIAHKPEIIFADEPTAELDTRTGLQIISVFKELVRSEGITVMMTTHDPNMMELADKVFTIKDGEITNDG
jgi:putative ABC transport system ATP-binding protein